MDNRTTREKITDAVGDEKRKIFIVDDRTFGEKVSDSVSDFGGSWSFILLASVFFAVWILFNTLYYFETFHFDKYPYILLNLVLSFIAAFQAPFIMMSQNRAEKKQDAAYRELFSEIKHLVRQDLDMEKKILKILKDMHLNNNNARPT